MKILITGGNGFIAKSLYEVLANEHTVLACNRNELDLFNTNLVFTYMKKNKFDVVIHTATYDAAPACSVKDPEKVLQNNLKMFFNLARCKGYFGKMIYFGSGAEFSREHWIPKMKENYFDQHVPADQYGFSKYIMNKYIQSSNNIYNLRLFGVFGKFDDWRYRFIPSSCCRAVLDLPLIIKQNKILDFIYIDDLIKIVKWFINNEPKNKTYNICTGTGHELKSIAEKILKIADKKLNILIEKNQSVKEYSGDNTLLLQELQNFNFLPIDNAIKDLYSWYVTNQHIIDQKQLL